MTDEFPIPICERCGGKMSKTPVYDTTWDEGVGEGPIKHFRATAHRHHFQCKACIPPTVVIDTPYPNPTGAWKRLY
jgi:hypothetical protein